MRPRHCREAAGAAGPGAAHMTSRMPRERATDDWLEGGDDPTITDRAGLAALTGLAPKEIDRALREGLPTLPRKRGVPTKFSVPAVVQWLLAQQGDSLESAKRRSLQATARKREVEAGRMEGELIPLARG